MREIPHQPLHLGNVITITYLLSKIFINTNKIMVTIMSMLIMIFTIYNRILKRRSKLSKTIDKNMSNNNNNNNYTININNNNC